ncbi:MAG: NUDIX hydrolase [Deltaproteobacteria bacterium]|nr:NUDIX hydrolase [Deltaproteobacteria bacterium]MBW2064309.1 NUDIX hydrolase [Deltaproteobacteria bacterium]
MKYCSTCGAPLNRRIPPGDDRPRFVCDKCHSIHYENPKIVVGCIPEWEQKILLCRRSIEPRYGFWTAPAGFLENGETVAEGARRETLEEACARVEIMDPYTLFDLTHVNQVYLMFKARLIDGRFGPGHESLEVKLFSEKEIPWDEIAFQSIKETLRLYFQDRAEGTFPLHTGRISPGQ